MNRGACALADRFETRGEQLRLAEKANLDQGYLSKIARAERVPGLDARRKLESHVGILMQWWDEAPTTEQLARVAAREAANEPPPPESERNPTGGKSVAS